MALSFKNSNLDKANLWAIITGDIGAKTVKAIDPSSSKWQMKYNKLF